MEPFLISTGVVALAEIGDKTQLLALLLAARFRRPLPIVAGIFVATLLNHAMAGVLGAWLTAVIGPEPMRWILGLSFMAIAAWMFIPDKIDQEECFSDRFGVFGTTVLAFFLAEMADKTQIATIALAAKYQQMLAVVLGTTLGMMIANVPVIWFGNRMAQKMPIKLIHIAAATIFALLGLAVLFTPLDPR